MTEKSDRSLLGDGIIKECYIELYKDILHSIYDLKNLQMRMSVDELLEKIKEIKLSEKKIYAVSIDDMDYTLKEGRCAYIYQYFLLHSKMVDFHFRKFLKENYLIRKKLGEMENLNICSLSGGSCIDAVAVVKVISDLGLRSVSNKKEPLNLEITIVDKYAEWEYESLKILQILKEHPRLNITSDVNIYAEFVKDDILHSLDDNLKKRLNKADIVTAVKIVKDVQPLFPLSIEIRKMIRNVLECMRVGSYFFMVERGGGGVPADVRRLFESTCSWKLIYDPGTHVTHTLNRDTIQKLARQFSLISRCYSLTKVFFHVWEKTEPCYSERKSKRNY